MQYADDKKALSVLTLTPDLEQRIIESRVETPGGISSALEPKLQKQWINSLSNAVKMVQDQGRSAIILCSEAARALVKASTVREIPHLVVVSVPEVVSDIRIESLGEIKLED
ncbi:MAG TPA: hypothetical protein ENI27_07095 [bacterium]|nr:hypothetical protein [bacterium]